MRDINQILKELIPPDNYQNRNGFSNEHLIQKLTDLEKKEVEKKLIQRLAKEDDTLIGESLVQLKSTDSLDNLKHRLKLSNNSSTKIIWASYINQINGGDKKMKAIALNELGNIKDKYLLVPIFHYLKTFNDKDINNKIKEFINHSDYLIAYNARTASGIDTKELIERENSKKKSWWKFW